MPAQDMRSRAHYRLAGGRHTAAMKNFLRWAVWLLLALAPILASADTLRGMPLLRRYGPEDYNATPQQLALTVDREGRLYVGNAEGILRYDGDKWQLIPLPGKIWGRSIQLASDGRVYVGSYDTFGWLRTTADGDIAYEELMTADGLKGADRNVGTVWAVVATDEGVYFRAEHALHFLSYDRKRAGHWPLADNVRQFYAEGNQLYARVEGVGFCRFKEGRFELEPGGALFANQPLPGMLNRQGWRLLVGYQGLFRADAEGIRPLPGNSAAELFDTKPYTVQALDDGSFVIGTSKGEVFRYGPDFRLRERVTLGNYGIVALTTDQQGGLWAATEGDLVRMALPSPWSFIGASQGLQGTVYDFEWYDNALWLASSRGLQKVTAASDGKLSIQATDWIDFEGYALVATESGMLIGHRNGLLVLDPGADKPRPLFTGEAEGAYELVRSTFDPDILYAIGDQQLFVVRRSNDRWQLDFMLPLDGASAGYLHETGRNELWFGDSRGGPQRWTLDMVNHKLLHKDVFAAADGLELDPHSGSTLYVLDGQIHVLSGDKSFRYEAPKFVPDNGPPFTLITRPNELQVEQTPLGTYAFSSRELLFRANGQPAWQPLQLGSQLAAGYSRLRFNQDGVMRIATWSGLLQYNQAEKQPVPVPLALGFDLITAESPDGQDFRRLPVVSQSTPIEIPAGYRLHFRYGLVSMDSGLEFRYMLHGTSGAEEWSGWTDRDLFVRALTPGDYLLEVQARTKSGRLAAPISYRYKILPRWYERLWVRLLGVLFLLGALALIVQEFIRRRTQRYVEANRKLEARIAERTHELEEVNRKLAELATEDALTGVANRRALENAMQREWYRCLDQRRPISVLMIDVDHFKRYNDAHGHLEGDVLLRAIAQHLQSQHDPKRELLARYGGEEFAMLLPGVHQEEAMRRAEEIRRYTQEQLVEITISIGVAGFVPAVHADASHLLRRADAALYRAKRGGRDRVEGDTDPPP